MSGFAQWVADQLAEGHAIIHIDGSDDEFALVDYEDQEVYLISVKRAKFVPVEGE